MEQKWRSRARYLMRSADTREAVNARSEVDRRLHFPRAQVEYRNFAGPRATYVSDSSAWTNQNFRRSFWNLQRTNDLQGLQINDVKMVRNHGSRQQPAAIRSWLRCVGHVRQCNPVGDFVSGRVDDSDAGRVLVVSEDAEPIRRDGNSLDTFGHGNRGDEFALRQIQHAHAAGADVGGVTALAVGRQNQHVGLRLARGNLRENLARPGIDDVDGIGKLGGDVQETVRSNFGAVRAERFAQIDGGGEFAFLQIDDINRAAVRPGPADAGVSVDRYISEAAVVGYDDFVAVHANRNFCQFAAILGIDLQHHVLFLSPYSQPSSGQCRWDCDPEPGWSENDPDHRD